MFGANTSAAASHRLCAQIDGERAVNLMIGELRDGCGRHVTRAPHHGTAHLALRSARYSRGSSASQTSASSALQRPDKLQQRPTLRARQVFESFAYHGRFTVMPEHRLFHRARATIVQKGWIVLTAHAVTHPPKWRGTPARGMHVPG